MSPALSIVMPAFNEEGNIRDAVKSAADVARRLVSSYEIIVIDDGSSDDTPAILEELQRTLPELHVVTHRPNRGYGAALRAGFSAARGELVFYTDSDNQFDLNELSDFLPLMSDWDAVLGYRRSRQDVWLRRLTSGVFNWLASQAAGLAVRDLNCSFKLFRRPVLQRLRLEATDFFIDTEIVAGLAQERCRVLQRGVTHLPRRAGHSSVRLSDVPKTLSSIARLWWRRRDQPLAQESL